MQLTKSLVLKLEEFGWSTEYKFDVEIIRRKLDGWKGLCLSPNVATFLGDFGGLSLSDARGTTFYLNPSRVRTMFARGTLPWSSTYFPVGISKLPTVLLMNDAGHFCLYYDALYDYADNPTKALCELVGI